MKRLIWIFTPLIIALLLIPRQPTLGQFECPGAPPPRLEIGAIARVTPGDANNVRDLPARGGALVGQIPGGQSFRVLDGPVCADGFAWWQIDYEGLIGWTVEGNQSAYFLELIATATPTPLPSMTPTPTPSATPTPRISPTPTPHPLTGVGRIAFVATDNRRLPLEQQSLTLYTMNADGSNLRPLVADIPWYAGVFHLRWSPDGGLLAFESFDLEPHREAQARGAISEDRHRRVYLVDAETGAVVYVTPRTIQARRPAWSPDGSQLALIIIDEETSAIYRMDRDGNNLERLTEPEPTRGKESLDWSPDGRQLIVALQLGGNFDLYTYDIETGGLQQVTSNVGDDYDPLWSRDGRHLYFTSYRPEDNLSAPSIYRIAPGGASTRLQAGAFLDGGPRLAPDGRWMAAVETQSPHAAYPTMRVIAQAHDGGPASAVTEYQFEDIRHLTWGP